MVLYRNSDNRYSFQWENSSQPPARWHSAGEGPVQYFADSPDGAWAEFLRHEEIEDLEDLAYITRALWAVEVPKVRLGKVSLGQRTLKGGPGSYKACQAEARRIKGLGYKGLQAPSAALSFAQRYRSAGGLQLEATQPQVMVLFGHWPSLRAWKCAVGGVPLEVMARVRPLRKK
jgi:hypothetical protein